MFLARFISLIKKFFSVFYNQDIAKEYRMDESKLNPTTSHLVRYSDELIPSLKGDHQDLLNRYVEIGTLVEQTKYHQAVEKINDFKEEFNRHLAQENVKFYAYCEQNFAESSHEYNTIKSYRKEMNLIAYSVIKFLKNWSAVQPLDAISADEFLEEYHEIASALARRIEDEERELYSLYHDVSLTSKESLQPSV